MFDRAWRWLVERRIQEAMRKGEFENLEGEGQPLHLNDDSHVDPSWRLALHMLKNAGLAPVWVDLDREVRERLKESRKSLARAARRWPPGDPRLQRAVERFKDRLTELNAKIDDLNLRVPAPSLQRPRLDLEREQQRVFASLGQDEETGP